MAEEKKNWVKLCVILAIMYLAIAGVFFVLVSLIPGMIKKRYKDVVEE